MSLVGTSYSMMFWINMSGRVSRTVVEMDGPQCKSISSAFVMASTRCEIAYCILARLVDHRKRVHLILILIHWRLIMFAIEVNNLGDIVVSSVYFPFESPWSTDGGEKGVHPRINDCSVSVATTYTNS